MLRLKENKMKVKQQKGITLIEILIVVALLMLILVAIFRTFRVDVNRANDAQRKSDLRDIKLAFEDHYNDRESYPPESYLEDCGGPSLRPYLREVPCDPETGKPYLYMPFPGDGDNTLGYRVLSILTDKSDPIIEKLGCQNGCGVPTDNSEYGNSINYVYGIAEGVPLVLDGYTPPGGQIPTNTSTPIPTLDPNYCNGSLCFCCANSAYVTGQDCNVWVPGNNCDMGPFTSTAECYNSTPCAPQ
jgi:type II secretory pathway pseudopilin PulG